MDFRNMFLRFANPQGYRLTLELIAELKADNADAQTVSELIDQGAALRFVDPETGKDAPMLALLKNRADLLKMMIDKKIDLNRRYVSRNAIFGNVSAMTLLDWSISSIDRHDCAKLLIENGADVNQDRPNNYTFLMEASYMAAFSPSSLELAKLMIARGTNLKVRDNEGQTALHHAAWSYSTDLVQAMLDKEPGLVNIADHKGRTPLLRIVSHTSRAADEVEQGFAKVAAILIARGANLSLKDKDGKTALDLAKANDRPEIAAMIETALAKKAPKGPQP